MGCVQEWDEKGEDKSRLNFWSKRQWQSWDGFRDRTLFRRLGDQYRFEITKQKQTKDKENLQSSRQRQSWIILRDWTFFRRGRESDREIEKNRNKMDQSNFEKTCLHDKT